MVFACRVIDQILYTSRSVCLGCENVFFCNGIYVNKCNLIWLYEQRSCMFQNNELVGLNVVHGVVQFY